MLVRQPVADPTLGRFAADSPVWCDEVDEDLVCTEVLQVTHDVMSFVLRSTGEARLFRFRAGQHLTLTVSVDGQERKRCYTISSSPLTPDTLTITVKRVPGGPVSNWLHDNLGVGEAVAATGPLGRFTTADHPADKYLFLSAGSGITPLMSMTRLFSATAHPADLVFVHSARTPDDIIFDTELDMIAAGDGRVRVAVVCEQDSALERWKGWRGRLSLEMMQKMAPDLGEREIFTCGPPPYMASVRAMLTEAGVDPTRCHEETFTFENPIVPTPGPRRVVPVGPQQAQDGNFATNAVEAFSIEFRRRERSIECDSTTTVLDAAASAGLTLPASCGEGLCGTCKTTLLSGSVEMDHAGGIRPREIADRKILLCCSTPRENLVLDA